MTPHAATLICEDDIKLFERIRCAVVNMIDIDLGTDEGGERIILSCHILARAVAKLFPVKVRDGYFLKVYDHSWVTTRAGNVIDTYPVGIVGGPIILDGSSSIPRRLYTPTSAKRISRGRFSKSSFERSVRLTIKAMRPHV